MKKIKENFIYAFIIFLELAFIFLLGKKCYGIIEINYFHLLIMGVALITTSFILPIGLKKICKYKSSWIIFKLLLILTIVICVWNKEKIFDNIVVKDMLRLSVEISKGNPTYFKDYFSVFIAIGPIVSAILLMIARSNFIEILVILNLAIYLFFLYIGYEFEIKDFKFLFAAINLFILINGVHRRYINRLKSKGLKLSLDRSEVFGKRFIILVVIITISSFKTHDDKGRYYEEIYTKVSSTLKASNGSGGISIDESGIATSGYIDTDKKLGGPLKISKDEVFKVYSNEGNLYLRAAVKDEYTGSLWKRSKHHEFDNTETLKVEDKNMQRTYESKIIKIETLKVGYNNYFTPINTINVKTGKGNSVYYNKENNLYINNKKITGEYKIEFFDEPKINGFKHMVSENKNSMYLSLPSSIPDRVQQLARDITKNSTSDLEKVMKIREYLSQNYVYDINVSNIPDGVDFVDYFLFNEKKGYCVYFATSFTVLSRAVGVQTRYVEGFKTTNNITQEGYISVTNEDAHAWAEVMIDPKLVQWSTVDCSPTLRDENQNKVNDTSTMSRNTLDMSRRQSDTGNNRTINEEELKGGDVTNGNTATEKKKLNIKGLRYPRRFLVSSFLAGVLLFIGLKVLKNITLVRSALDKKTVRPLYSYVSRRLKSVGYIKEKFETEMEFINKIDDKDIKSDLLRLVDEVYKEFYGNQVGNFDNRREFLQRVENFVRGRTGTVEYIFKKYYKN